MTQILYRKFQWIKGGLLHENTAQLRQITSSHMCFISHAARKYELSICVETVAVS